MTEKEISMKDFDIRDPELWESGRRKIEWVKRYMPLLSALEEEFVRTKPFRDLRVSLSVHLEAKTAYLCEVLAAGGAEMAVTGSNVLSTQDDVAAALVRGNGGTNPGMSVYAYHGATDAEYARHIEQTLEHRPHLIIDDGGDLVGLLHTKRPDLAECVIGGCEETTTGIHRLRAMEREGVLKFPMVAVNDAKCKHFFDNRYGTGQSVVTALMQNTNLILAGKDAVVAGYGWCGKGVAMRLASLGARVIVTEVDPVAAMEAVMDGYRVMTMDEAAPVGDFFCTVTGCEKVITTAHMMKMKDGAILSNAGHFNVEVDMPALESFAVKKTLLRNNVVGYTLPNGRTVAVIAEGRLVNIAAGDGHPAEIMDLSFAVQALSALYVLEHRGKLENRLYDVSDEIDERIARRKLAAWGIRIDELTEEQKRYLSSWQV